jgi:Ca-activated chloride channel family protein
VHDRVAAPSEDLAFASAVAELGMLLRESPHRGAASLAEVIARAEGALGADEGGFRRQFVALARTLQRMELLAAR